MSKNSRNDSAAVAAYLLLLLAFAMLGLFVAALAHGSAWAPLAGVGLAGSLLGAVTGFRAAAGPDQPASIWARPVDADQVARYAAEYRDGPTSGVQSGEPVLPVQLDARRTPDLAARRGGNRSRRHRHEIARVQAVSV